MVKIRLQFLAFLCLAAVACTTENESPRTLSNPPYQLTNDQSVISPRMDFTDAGKLYSLRQGANPNSRIATVDFRLELISEINPPSTEKGSLQAANVRVTGNHLVISYNTEGSTYLGGVDILDISNPSSPRLISQVIFNDGNVSDAFIHDGHLYFAGALDMDVEGRLASPAVSGRIALNLESQATDDYIDIDLKSFVGTSTDWAFDRIVSTSGNGGGGLTIINEAFQEEGFVSIPNSRSVAVGDTILAVLQGEPGRITVLDNQFNVTSNFSIPGSQNPEAKGQVDFLNSYLAVTGGLEGILVFDPSTGGLVKTLEMVQIDGVLPSDISANGLVTDGSSVFMANGAAGLYVADLIGNDLEILGSFDTDASSNGVAIKDDLVFIASGTAGSKILKLTKSKPVQEGEIFNLDFSTSTRDDLAVKGWVFQSFTQSGNELRGGRYGGPDRSNLLSKTASQKNQIKIPASHLISVDELSVEVRRDQPYELYVWLQKKDGTYIDLGLTRMEDNSNVQRFTFDLEDAEDIDYVILGGAPAANGYGRIFISKIAMSGKY